MKLPYVILTLFLSFGLTLAGALCKIMHYPGAALLLLTGLAGGAVSAGLLFVRAVRG